MTATFGPAGAPDVSSLAAILVSLGRASPAARVRPLAGGVSSAIAVVEDGTERWVAKTPLARLAVADVWRVDRSRGGNEAAILAVLAGAVGPMRTPVLRFFEPSDVVLGMEWLGDSTGAPPATYKDELLSGRVDPAVAESIGLAMGALHRIDPPPALEGDGPRALFDDLRLDPYYRTSARRVPALADDFARLMADGQGVASRRLVHGDCSPKNVLVGGPGACALVDWEVVHCGDPAFDLGMMTAHLALKSLRGVDDAERRRLGRALAALWCSYDGPAPPCRALRHAGAIMVARLHGKSPVEYLTDSAERARARAVGAGALAGAARCLGEFTEGLERAWRGEQPWEP